MHLPRLGALAKGKNIAAIATLSEELGFASLWCGDHVAFPWQTSSHYPYAAEGMYWNPTTPWVDPLVSLSWAGAVTSRIGLGTSILLLPLRPTLLVAKAVASLDHISNGRVLLGVGVGWLEEEFKLVGQTFADRGERTSEAIRVLKACWSNEKIEFHGRFHQLDAFAMEPKPVQGGRLPILCGGFSDAALRRVAEVADGWLPSHLVPEEYAKHLPRLRELAERQGRSLSDLYLATTPGREHPLTYDSVMRYEQLGVQLVVGDADFAGTLDNALASIEKVARDVRLGR